MRSGFAVRVLLFDFAGSLLLQILHVFIVVFHIVFVCSNGRLSCAGQRFVPLSLSLLLLVELLLLFLLHLLCTAVCVLLDHHAHLVGKLAWCYRCIARAGEECSSGGSP